MDFLSYLIFGLSFILSDFINCNVKISCNNVLEYFKNGINSFEIEHNLIQYLTDNGYVTQPGEPFSNVFGTRSAQPLPTNISENFFGINSVLRGMQSIFDNYIGQYNNIKRPTEDDITEFFEKASDCIPNYMKFAKNIEKVVCDTDEKYRSVDGKCNNLDKPQLGAGYTVFSRLVPAFYDDNILDIRKNWQGHQLNSPRKIVNDIWFTKERDHLNLNSNRQIPNLGWYMFGQLLSHDIAAVLSSPHPGKDDTPLRCCSADYKNFISKSKMSHTCLPFEIPRNDKYHRGTNLFCHNFIRSQPYYPNDFKLGPAQQINRVTHFIDLSVIYGGTKEMSDFLRTFEFGRLKTNQNNFLPTVDNCEPNCYFSGDSRASQTPSLHLLHLAFVRLHNIIAIKLLEIKPEWCDEILFQESRRINIAIYQNIVFNHYLPILIGERLQLSNTYNQTVNPSTTNDFITGVFRSIHFLTPSHFVFYSPDYQIIEHIRIADMLTDNKDYLKSNFDDLVRGLLFQEINTRTVFEQIINHLFNGTDLISVDIQRGLDHGIAPYWRYRQFCGYPVIKTFSNLYQIMSKKNVARLRSVYSSPKDIDLYVGGFLEERGNNIMGPTFSCIAKIQFARYATGDRFFYLHENNPHPFSKEQLEEIHKFNFAKLMCLVTNVEHATNLGFFIQAPSLNFRVDCSTLRNLDLTSFK